jgi:hypothetical protein
MHFKSAFSNLSVNLILGFVVFLTLILSILNHELVFSSSKTLLLFNSIIGNSFLCCDTIGVNFYINCDFAFFLSIFFFGNLLKLYDIKSLSIFINIFYI